jgi:hypothetical protein
MIKQISASLLILSATCACDKAPNDGDLDGNWQLVSVQEDAQSSVKEVKGERLYVGFRRGIALYYSVGSTSHLNVYAHYTHTSDSLFVYDFASASDDTNPFYTTPEPLKLFYITHLRESYAIEQLSGDQMWLSQGEKKLQYRKF